MASITKNPLNAAGQIFQFVGTAFAQATNALDAVANGIDMANTTVSNIHKKHKIDASIDLSNYMTNALNKAKLTAAQEQAEIANELRASPELKDLYDDNDARLRKVFTATAKDLGLDAYL